MCISVSCKVASNQSCIYTWQSPLVLQMQHQDLCQLEQSSHLRFSGPIPLDSCQLTRLGVTATQSMYYKQLPNSNDTRQSAQLFYWTFWYPRGCMFTCFTLHYNVSHGRVKMIHEQNKNISIICYHCDGATLLSFLQCSWNSNTTVTLLPKCLH